MCTSICIALSCPIIIITMFHYNDRYQARKILVESSFTVWTWISLSNIQVRTVDKGEEVKWIQQGGAVGRGLVCNIAAAIDTSIPWLKWNQPTPLALHGIAPLLRRSAKGYTYAPLCAYHSVPFVRLCALDAVHRRTIERTFERIDFASWCREVGHKLQLCPVVLLSRFFISTPAQILFVSSL